MPVNTHFPHILGELEIWQAAGQKAKLWLRDDDAHEPSKQLDRLLAAMNRHGAHCLLAVIPFQAGHALANRLAQEPLARVAVHGARHANNAAPGGRAEEMALTLGLPAIRAELCAARARLVAFFGESAGQWYVPPWNRISHDVVTELPGLGFSALSTFGEQDFGLCASLHQFNAHVDFINWKAGRTGHPPEVIDTKIADALATARRDNFRAIGLLTHHLQHDEAVWTALEKILDLISGHTCASWHDPDILLTSTPYTR